MGPRLRELAPRGQRGRARRRDSRNLGNTISPSHPREEREAVPNLVNKMPTIGGGGFSVLTIRGLFLTVICAQYGRGSFSEPLRHGLDQLCPQSRTQVGSEIRARQVIVRAAPILQRPLTLRLWNGGRKEGGLLTLKCRNGAARLGAWWAKENDLINKRQVETHFSLSLI